MKKFQVKANLLLAEKDELLYVLDVEPGRIHSFNITAKVIFQLCMQPRTEEEIIAEYRNYFELDFSSAQEDVRLMLDMLTQAELLADIEL